ncbi:MAG: ABC transporter substrate-binding protein [Candidatus Cloacimonetes bacterium]|nr:ABC transporter substrate-binding protein [Candidatus Cloacimonadota bacterium]
MNKIFFVFFIFSVLLFSCEKKDDSAQNSNVVEIEFWHGMGGPLGDALDSLIDEFNETHPKIYVNAVHMGNYTALSQKLMASIQTNGQPDIAQSFEAWTANFMEGDVLRCLEDFIADDPDFSEEDLNDFYPVFIKSNTMDGKLMSFPFNKSVSVLYYNKDILFMNDLDPNKPPTNWDEYREMFKLLTQDTDGDGKNDIFGSTFTISAWQFENLLLQAGGEIMNEDNTKALFNSKEGIEALQFIYNILMKDKTVYLSAGYDGQNDFLAGKVAMVEGSSVSMVFMRKNGIDFNLGISAIPTYKTKRSLISGTNIVIFKKEDEKRQQAAWEFIKWFTDTRQTAKWSELTYYMPVRRSAFEEEGLKNRLISNPEIASVYNQLEYASFEPQISEWFETRKFLEEHVIEKVIRGILTPEEALENAAEMLEKKILKNREKK